MWVPDKQGLRWLIGTVSAAGDQEDTYVGIGGRLWVEFCSLYSAGPCEAVLPRWRRRPQELLYFILVPIVETKTLNP